MKSARYGEHAPPPYRSSRLYRADMLWYFDTREGTQFGPFQNQEDAQKALAIFVAQKVFEWPEEELTAEDYPGTQDGVESMVKEVVEILRCERDFGALAAQNLIFSRLEDLRSNVVVTSETRQIADVLEYAHQYGAQLFDTGAFETDSM